MSSSATATSAANGTVLTMDRSLAAVVESEEVARRMEFRAKTIREKVEVLKEISESRDSFVLLIYDIPSVLDDEVANPSPILWRHGFRLNKSCWCLPQREIDTPAIQELFGFWADYPAVSYHVVPFHEKATAKIRELARIALEEELIRQGQSLLKRMFDARGRLDAAIKRLDEACMAGKEVSFLQYENADAAYIAACKTVIKDAEEDYNSIVECVKLFEEEGSSRLGIASLFDGLRAIYRSQVSLYNAECELRNVPGKAVPVPEALPKDTPVSHVLQKGGRTYTFFPLEGGEETVIVLTAPNKPKKGPGSEGEDGQLYGKSRERVPTVEAEKTFLRLKREGWAAM